MAEEKSRAEQVKMTISWKEIGLYGVGSSVNMFQLNITGYYLMYFMTEILQMNTIVAATVNTIIQWLKVITQTTAGVLMDSFRLKGGNSRQWLLVGELVMLVSLPLTFLDTSRLGTALSVGIFLVMYTIMMIGYNVVWTAQRSITGEVSKNASDLVGFMSYGGMVGTIVGLFWAPIWTVISGVPLWANTSNMYAGASLLGCIAMLVGSFAIRAFAPKEDRVVSSSKGSSSKITIKDMISNVRGPVLVYSIAQAFGAGQGPFISTLLTYFATYVIGDPSLTAKAISAASVGTLIGNLIFPQLVKRLGQKKTFLLGELTSAVLFLATYAAIRNGTLFLILRVLQNAFCQTYILFLTPMAVDIGDWNEMEGRKQSPSFLQAWGGTVIRLGWTLGVMISSYALAFGGYTAGAEITPTVASTITHVMILGPTVMTAISGLSILFYKIPEKELQAYREKRAAAAQT